MSMSQQILFALVFAIGTFGQCASVRAQSAAGMTLDVCPSSYDGFKEDAPPLTCGCTREAAKSGTVWGANPYYWQSAVCRAAWHAGVISAAGGQVLVTPENAPVFPAVNRNGIGTSGSNGGFGFRVAAVPKPAGTS